MLHRSRQAILTAVPLLFLVLPPALHADSQQAVAMLERYFDFLTTGDLEAAVYVWTEASI